MSNRHYLLNGKGRVTYYPAWPRDMRDATGVLVL